MAKSNNEILAELVKERMQFLERYPHLKVLQNEIHRIEAESGHDPITCALEINRLLTSHLSEDTFPEFHEFIRKYQSEYLLNIDKYYTTSASFPSLGDVLDTDGEQSA
ncbi:MAG: hypothetical protein HOE90_02885 [Bacteriovoracaceae bacterium]|mgnify:FL=1|jgi:hypothetical protein|nr:hypothetical protein [Bacteriovoracaceae bacterium]